MRKLTELPTALIGAERWQLFIESVCCIPFVEVSATSNFHLNSLAEFVVLATNNNKKPLLNVSGVFSIAANWGHTQKKEIINVKINKYILKKLIKT